MPTNFFQRELLNWYFRHKRDLPWRKTNDPYRIWLSEIILQQTRVAQGLPYYEKFVRKYPRVADLALADEAAVLKDWEGLGYYSRARNLHAAARDIHQRLGGEFPTSYEELLKIKGIGDYTASAISSFCAGEARPVVDGNVNRLISRYLGIREAANTTEGQKRIKAGVKALFLPEQAADFNQAIMEFGALQCVPRNPDCDSCPLQGQCVAHREGLVEMLPVKQQKTYKRKRYFHYFIFLQNGTIALEQRQEKDIWQGLFQFPLQELPEGGQPEGDFRHLMALKPHKLSHQEIHINIWEAPSQSVPAASFRWVEIEALDQFAFPRPLRRILDINALPLHR